ncbi:MAG: hypothetical protein JW750_09330 [Anaerolineaceae bacterium]|nr:hypothetical protein [Anaerolineaceae bacterium]
MADKKESTPTSEPENAQIDQKRSLRYSAKRVQSGLIVSLIGFLIFILGTRPSMFGLDRSPVIGFIQIAVFLVGLALICLGGYVSMMALWGEEQPSILADIGTRLVATGYVISVFSGMADVFGLGSHLLPDVVPYFGELQAIGVVIGVLIIAWGLLFLIPYHRLRHHPRRK